jgi:formylglycine-generating enzyme required for sulfatase activity
MRLVILAFLLVPSLLAQVPGMALVIGNGRYPEHPVPSAYNDALDVAVRLRAIGYKVDLHTECDRRTFYRVVREHLSKARQGPNTIIYYSGHAVQVNGKNYLVPIGVLPETPQDVELGCIAIDDILAKMASYPFSLVLLDACREHPFSSSGPGLASIMPPAGGMVCQAAPPGEVTRDASETHSLFTKTLLRLLGLPDLSLPEMVGRLRDDIMKATNGAQIPWIRRATDAPVAESAAVAPPVLQTPQAAPSETRGVIRLRSEVAGTLYIDGHRITGLDGGREYRLRRIQAGERVLRVVTADNQIWEDSLDIEPGSEVAAVAKFAPKLAMPPEPGIAPEPYEIDELGLQLLVVPAGTFSMGSPETEKGRSLGEKERYVAISRPFWLGRTEITNGQYFKLFGKAPDGHSGRPVDRVSWEEAMDWCGRLTARERAAGRLPEGYEIRLPTEAEWEYACRAGTSRAYAGRLSEMAWYDGVVDTPREVAMKEANRWGFHDMHGNAWEHVYDFYDSYRGNHLTDPTGPPSGRFRTIRGGSCLDDAAHCRSAFRRSLPSQARLVAVGFRIALAPVIPRD